MASEPWLRLMLAASKGSQRWLELLRTHGSAAAVTALSPAELESSGVSRQAIDSILDPDSARLDQWRAWLARPHCALVSLDHDAYPPLLRLLPDAPLALWVEGRNLGYLSAAQLAIVGSRNPTRGGRETAEASGEVP